MIWGTTALKHATSWQHVDDEGFGTVVTNMVGCKYWVLGRRRRDAPMSEWDNQIRSGLPFGKNIRTVEACSDIWEHEGLLLTPGTVL
jgi:hypothetical protein